MRRWRLHSSSNLGRFRRRLFLTYSMLGVDAVDARLGVSLMSGLARTAGSPCGLVESEAMFSDLPVERRVATWVRRADTAVGPPYFLDVIAKA